MNIKKFDTVTYYNTINCFTTESFLEDGVLCKTKDYEYKNINYILPNEVYFTIKNMIDDFIKSNKEFKLIEVENLIAPYSFSIYKKRVASKKISLFFINLKLSKKEISTENGFNFTSK